ncbi:MAG: Lpg1974 family pore-forming outer membrane protein [Parachlamydiales bacterium]
MRRLAVFRGKCLFILPFVLASHFVCADESWDDLSFQDELLISQNDGKSSHGNEKSSSEELFYNPKAAPIVKKDWDLWARGDLLIWQAAEDNLLNCFIISSNLNTPHRGFNQVDLEWDLGFRLQIGYTAPYDGWDLSLDWTRYTTDADSTVHAKGNNHIPSPAWGASAINQPILFLERSKAKWHLHFNQLDLELGRSYYVGKYFTLRPNFGLRSAWIDQKLHFDYISSTPSLSVKGNLHNRFWGIGLMLGMGADWLFNKHWSLFGETDYALLFGDFDISQSGKRSNGIGWNQKKDFDSGKGVLDIAAGIKYHFLFHKERLGLTFRTGYEYHVYFNQNQYLISNGSDNFENFIEIKGNLAFQGVMISGQFDF